MEWFESSKNIDAFIVIETTELIRGEEFTFLTGLLHAVTAVHAFIFCGAYGPNGLIT